MHRQVLYLLKEMGICHCDLKPENILLQNLHSPAIKLIDFGSACEEQHTQHTYIQSRFYRSPEVLLGMAYGTPIDMWSLGTIVAELFLGLPIFPGESEYNQLARIVATCGMPPDEMIEAAPLGMRFFQLPFAHPRQKSASASASAVASEEAPGRSPGSGLSPVGPQHNSTSGVTWYLRSEVSYCAEFGGKPTRNKQYFKYTSLYDLYTHHPPPKPPASEAEGAAEQERRRAMQHFCEGLLHLDPALRWTPDEAIRHPFITGEPWNGHFVLPERASSASTIDNVAATAAAAGDPIVNSHRVPNMQTLGHSTLATSSLTPPSPISGAPYAPSGTPSMGAISAIDATIAFDTASRVPSAAPISIPVSVCRQPPVTSQQPATLPRIASKKAHQGSGISSSVAAATVVPEDGINAPSSVAFASSPPILQTSGPSAMHLRHGSCSSLPMQIPIQVPMPPSSNQSLPYCGTSHSCSQSHSSVMHIPSPPVYYLGYPTHPAQTYGSYSGSSPPPATFYASPPLSLSPPSMQVLHVAMGDTAGCGVSSPVHNSLYASHSLQPSSQMLFAPYGCCDGATYEVYGVQMNVSPPPSYGAPYAGGKVACDEGLSTQAGWDHPTAQHASQWEGYSAEVQQLADANSAVKGAYAQPHFLAPVTSAAPPMRLSVSMSNARSRGTSRDTSASAGTSTGTSTNTGAQAVAGTHTGGTSNIDHTRDSVSTSAWLAHKAADYMAPSSSGRWPVASYVNTGFTKHSGQEHNRSCYGSNHGESDAAARDGQSVGQDSEVRASNQNDRVARDANATAGTSSPVAAVAAQGQPQICDLDFDDLFVSRSPPP